MWVSEYSGPKRHAVSVDVVIIEAWKHSDLYEYGFPSSKGKIIPLLNRGLSDILMKTYDVGHLFCLVINLDVGLNIFIYLFFFEKDTTERDSWPYSMLSTKPSCVLTRRTLLCWPTSEWFCHGFHTLPLYTTFSCWPFRTSCLYCWCSALLISPSTLCALWCKRRKESSRCVCVLSYGL